MDALTIAAASGIRSRMQSLDLLANNIANSATAGFKRDSEYYGLYHSEASSGESGLPVIERQWTDFSQGAVQVTGNPMDVALNGSGFLVVNGATGPLYTRNGNLQVAPNGSLSTAEGFPLQDAITGKPIQITAGKPMEISTDGTITQDGQPVGQLKIVDFKNLQSLSKLGSECFQNTDPKNAPTAALTTQVQQGKIEGSNVPVAEAAMRLVGVMRQFEMLQKAVGISGEMDTKTIQEVARVGS
jgi:flagellar basal-body rod protein FlgF